MSAQEPLSPSSSIDDDNYLPSPSTSSDSSVDENELSDAERQWRESLQQLELLLTMVVVPYVGKYYGRKAAYWIWAKAMEWNFPVQVVVTEPAAFKGTGAVEAAASL